MVEILWSFSSSFIVGGFVYRSISTMELNSPWRTCLSYVPILLPEVGDLWWWFRWRSVIWTKLLTSSFMKISSEWLIMLMNHGEKRTLQSHFLTNLSLISLKSMLHEICGVFLFIMLIVTLMPFLILILLCLKLMDHGWIV